MGEKYVKKEEVMVMTLKQLAELERLWATTHDSLKILDKYIEEEGKQFKLSEAEDILDIREKIGEAIIMTRVKWATLGSAIRKFNGDTLQ